MATPPALRLPNGIPKQMVSFYLPFLALRHDAEAVLVDEQIAVLERPALRPGNPPKHHRNQHKQHTSNNNSKRDASSRGHGKAGEREMGGTGDHRNLPMVDSCEGSASFPGFPIGRRRRRRSLLAARREGGMAGGGGGGDAKWRRVEHYGLASLASTSLLLLFLLWVFLTLFFFFLISCLLNILLI